MNKTTDQLLYRTACTKSIWELAEFVMDHCTRNGIITEEQAAGKRGSWGCVDQLLVNKMIYREVKERRRNIITVWLDYKKAFDSVPHA